MKKIHVDGSNGIADITWGDVVKMMNARSRDGRECVGTSPRSKIIASRQT
jgi:hypothetical protein